VTRICTLREVQLPDGVNSSDIRCINANGVIAGIGSLAPSSEATSQTTMARSMMQANASASSSPKPLLLLPFELTIPGETYQSGADADAKRVGSTVALESNPRPTVELQTPTVTVMESEGIARVTISEFTGLTSGTDSFYAKVSFISPDNAVKSYEAALTETGTNTNTFTQDIVVPGEPIYGAWEAQVGDVEASDAGTCVPVTLHVTPPGDPGDYRLKLYDTEFELDEDDGEYYLKGGSTGFVIMMRDPADATKRKVIYYDGNGVQVKSESIDAKVKFDLTYKPGNQSLLHQEYNFARVELKDVKSNGASAVTIYANAKPIQTVGCKKPVPAEATHNQQLTIQPKPKKLFQFLSKY